MVLVSASAYAARGGTSGEEVAQRVQSQFPLLLAVTLGIVGLVLAWLLSADPGRWSDVRWVTRRRFFWDVGLGVLVGTGLAALYFGPLERLLDRARTALGDYVPAGSTQATLGGSAADFFMANVLLAPLVEEVWYRGLLHKSLTASYGLVPGAVLACIAFGLFHWPGGLWYMIATGVLVGGAFTVLRVMQDSLLALYSAHLALNAIEFVVLVCRQRAE
ncbi:MAG: CPBP family intramembrane glutamic endopeptidase [Rhodothermales bacterium]